MIHICLKGRLGNNLFQYAVGRALALRHNVPLTLYTYELDDHEQEGGARFERQIKRFNLQAKISTEKVYRHGLKGFSGILNRLGGPLSRTCIFEKTGRFQPELQQAPDDSCLHGYFQSEQYFKDIESIIRRDLTWKNNLTDEPMHQLACNINMAESVSVHVRRADYLITPLHQVCTEAYFIKSIRYMKRRLDAPYFFVFSDDIAWCKTHMTSLFTDSDVCFVDRQDAGKTSEIDLWLMSACRHHIIANSSFSWWGAWLNSNPDKIVLAPYKWFSDTRRNEAIIHDIIPRNWTRITF